MCICVCVSVPIVPECVCPRIWVCLCQYVCLWVFNMCLPTLCALHVCVCLSVTMYICLCSYMCICVYLCVSLGRIYFGWTPINYHIYVGITKQLGFSNKDTSIRILFPRWFSGKESACEAGDAGSIPELGRSSEEGNGNPLQYSCLGNPMDRWALQVIVYGIAKSQTQLSN